MENVSYEMSEKINIYPREINFLDRILYFWILRQRDSIEFNLKKNNYKL